MRKTTIVSGFAAAVLLLAATGCYGNEQPEPKAKAYDEDGYMGITNTNPNLPTNPGYRTYNKDFEMMNQTLRKIKGVRSSSIVLNGSVAYIRINYVNGLTSDEKKQVRKNAYKSLRYMMPRYIIKVTD